MTFARKRILTAAGVALTGIFTYWAVAQPRPASLAEMVPVGPLLYLEAKDLGGLLKDWNASVEKSEWTKSDAFQVFTRSRLSGRLEQAQTEFAAAAGAPPNYAMLSSIAGAESALAVYDIGNLEFLFLTKLPAARAAESALWKARGSAQSRRAAGAEYFIKTEKASNRTVAFAAAGGWLVLATREDLLTGALALIANPGQTSLRQERWFDLAVTAATNGPRELRMAANMERLTVSPHFRSYWIQKNVSQLTQFRSALADLDRSGGAFTERRILQRPTATSDTTTAEAGVAQILRLVPDQAGLYRAWAGLTPQQAVDLIRYKVFGEPGFVASDNKHAPVVSESDGAIGNESDLERRIDEPALIDNRSAGVGLALSRLFGGVNLSAGLQVSSNKAAPNGVFLTDSNVLVFAGPQDWNSTSARNALTEVADSLWTAGQLGAGWTSRRAGAAEFFTLDGPGGVACAVSGRLLFIANNAPALQELLARLNAAPAQGALYAAGYRHNTERPNYERMMRLIDFPMNPAPALGEAREPAFFSGTLASLGRVLARTQSASIVAHDNGAQVTETVVYRMR